MENIEYRTDGNITYYIFEFHQGHLPQVLWNSGPPIEDVDGLMWYSVTTPVVQESDLDNTKPSVYHSTYKSNDFVAFYQLIPDVEARGFTRTVCVCVLSKKDINAITRNTDFEDKVAHLFRNSVEKAYPSFRKEMEEYVGALQSTIKSYPESADLLKQIEEEILTIANKLNITPDTTQKEKSPEVFSRINNDLRDVKTLFDFDGLVSGLLDVSHETFDSCECAKIQKFAHYHENKPNLNFGGITGDTYPKFAGLIFKFKEEVKNDRFTLTSLLKSKNFQHILFSVLCGIPLIIESKNPNASILARKFSTFVPFFEESSLEVINEENVKTTRIAKMKKSIFVCLSLIRDSDQSFAILNLDKCHYEGPLCPAKSFVFSELSPALINDVSFLLLVFSRLKDLGTKFVNIISTLNRKSISDLDVISRTFSMNGFNDFDLSVLQYWMTCLVKYENVDVVPMPKTNPLLEGIVAYFENR
jgi:hypothetical protein